MAITLAPVPPILSVSTTAAPVPISMVLAFAEVPILICPVVPESIDNAVAAGVVRSGLSPPVKVTWPVEETLKFDEVKVNACAPSVQVEAAAPVKFNAPAEVTAKVPEVTVESVKPFEVVEMVDVPRPVRDKAPEVPVRLIAPVVKVKPLLAVRSPADVTVPEPDVEIFPDVVIASPEVPGDKVVPALFQKANVPVVGAVEVRFLEASV